SPVIEEGLATLMREVVHSGRVQVTTDAVLAVHNTDVSFICVGTPTRPNGSQDLRALERLCTQLGVALESKTGYRVFVVRSTVAPGTVEEILVPLLEAHSGKRLGRDFGACFQPEFLREGSSIRDFDRPPFTVVGGDSERSVT